MARRKLSDRRGRHDAAYRRAKDEGYAGRAIYKLEELDRRFRLVGPGKRVLDLGCWPGSWLQYLGDRVGEDGTVVGIDLRPVDLALPEHVTTVVADVETLDPAPLRDGGRFDVVVSDMAPTTTGDRQTDQYRSEELVLAAARIAAAVLRPGGHFAAKIFQGARFAAVRRTLEAQFQTVKAFTPPSTRAGSFEQYLVARGLRRAQP